MATFYIDYENVHNAGLRGLDFLSEDDHVYIFYSENANTFNVDSMKIAMNSVCGIDFVEANVGTPNAMDFQIITLVYAMIEADDMHYIISKDKGFDAAIRMGERCNLKNVERFPDIKVAYNCYQLSRPKAESLEEQDQENEDGVQEEVFEEVVEEKLSIDNVVEIDINEVKLADGSKRKIKTYIQKKCGVTVSKSNLDIAYDGLTSCTTKMQLYNFFRSRLGNDDGNKLYKLVGENYYELRDVV